MDIKVKDAVSMAAQALGLGEEVALYLNGEESAVGKKAVELLVACFEKVESELALDYLPLIEEIVLISGTGTVTYASLSKNVARILCVEDEWGESVKYKLFPTYLKTQAGKLKIIYAYAPAKKTIDGTSEYKTLASKRLIVDGMCAEYSLAVGELTAASIWDKKYKEGVRAAYRVSPCKRLRSRRWI